MHVLTGMVGVSSRHLQFAWLHKMIAEEAVSGSGFGKLSTILLYKPCYNYHNVPAVTNRRKRYNIQIMKNIISNDLSAKTSRKGITIDVIPLCP